MLDENFKTRIEKKLFKSEYRENGAAQHTLVQTYFGFHYNMMLIGTALDLARARLCLSISNGREKQSSSFSSAQQGATFVFSELDEELKHVSGMSGEI